MSKEKETTAAKQTEMSDEQRFGGKRTLTTGKMILYGVAFMVITSWVTSYGPATSYTHGMVALGYAIASVAMLFTAYSYSKMSKEFPYAGSAYTYSNKVLNPHIGFMVGWCLIMDYILLPMLCIVASATMLSAVFTGIPVWVWALGIILIVTIVNLLGLTVTIATNFVIVGIQVIAMVVMVVMIFKYLLGGGGAGTLFDMKCFIDFDAFKGGDFGFASLITGASILCVNFLGFDAISTLAEEAKNPRRDVGRAMILTCVIAGVTFTLFSYLIQLVWPTSHLVITDTDSIFVAIMDKVSPTLSAALALVYVIGAVACSINSTASGTRIMFAMGRDAIIPKKIFGYLSPKRRVPTFSILLFTLVSMTALFIDLSAAFSLVSYGALLGFVAVNIAVIVHYFVRKKQRSGWDIVRYLIAPILGAFICAGIFLSLESLAKIGGTSWLLLGIIYLMFKTKFFKELPPEMDLTEKLT